MSQLCLAWFVSVPKQVALEWGGDNYSSWDEPRLGELLGP